MFAYIFLELIVEPKTCSYVLYKLVLKSNVVKFKKDHNGRTFL